MDGIQHTVGLADQGISQLFEYGLTVTFMTLMLMVSISFNIYLVRSFIKSFNIIRDFTSALTILNERLSHD